ncbi:nucleotide exchange factor GrpE [Anaeromyxobacter sp. Fw109-5]|uniref:nucleotide exchange factor GrpE n=1 Tax=Anaeromyxobacter sp. (strain Fw109-5) TaxID=404589 RepID=UPI0000ED8B49|nr:nucleotide exchange factor GrpE [Anaeromyxobacter sp. Fw109-5]ABS26248.1 GrpE protein [Anaeromyxobacter sp. Fw109-5]
MSEERRGAPAPEAGEPQVKVVDRRRFRPDGRPVEGDPEQTPGAGADAPSEEAAAPETAADPREAQLAAQQARIEELARAYAALVEDNKAFRQRLERERARVVEAERVNVAQALLEAADDLERALAAVSTAGEGQGDALRNLAEGVRLSLASLHKRIAELGAQRIPVQGQRFDPHVAEAIDTIAVADAEQDGVVLHEIRPGYRIGERVLRPARVRVGRLAQA